MEALRKDPPLYPPKFKDSVTEIFQDLVPAAQSQDPRIGVPFPGSRIQQPSSKSWDQNFKISDSRSTPILRYLKFQIQVPRSSMVGQAKFDGFHSFMDPIPPSHPDFHPLLRLLLPPPWGDFA